MDGLDNLGENLIRLATSLKTLEESPVTTTSDFAFAEATGKLAEAYDRAFRQTHPVLVSSEDVFIELVADTESQSWVPGLSEERPHQAGSLVHEAILSSQEIVSLLARIAQAGRIHASMTRRLLEPSLPPFTESASVIGWELKGICHEYRAEVKLLGHAPASLKDLGAGARALATDMVDAASRLRSARREWFRIDHRLAAATGAAGGVSTSDALPPGPT